MNQIIETKDQTKYALKIVNEEINHTIKIIEKLEKNDIWLTSYRKLSTVYKNQLGHLYRKKQEYEYRLSGGMI